MTAAAGMSSGARLGLDIYVRSAGLTADEEIAKGPRRRRGAGAAAARFVHAEGGGRALKTW